jgi:hypothetical protein
MLPPTLTISTSLTLFQVNASKSLKDTDSEVFGFIQGEYERQKNGIQLIASEALVPGLSFYRRLLSD